MKISISMMTPTDAIFWNKQTVPHGSVNLGQDRDTKERVAFTFDFVVKDIEPSDSEMTFGSFKHMNRRLFS